MAMLLVPALTCKNKILVWLNRRNPKIDSSPDGNCLAHIHVLPFGKNSFRAWNSIIVDPIVAVPTCAPVPYLHEPRPDLFGFRPNRDRPRRIEDWLRLNLVAGHRSLHFFLRR
jgi:hypothetical protein